MMVAKEFLKRWKVNIREAKNGKIAQQVLLDHNDVDLLLLDLQMPEMNGYELMEWINTTELDLPVIAFTAEIMANEEKNDLFNRGFDDLVPKPFAPEELHNKMKACLQKKRKGKTAAMA
jgi:CheY-like chemotaxis protein